MGIAQSALVAVSNLNVEMTVFCLIFAMWWHKRGSFVGAFSVLFILYYHIVVRLGSDVMNPLNLYVGLDYAQAKTILMVVYPTFVLAFGIMGTVWSLWLDRVTLLPFSDRLPGFLGGTNMPAERFGIENPPPPSWFHFIITLFCLFVVSTGQILYTYYMYVPGRELWAWMFGLWIPVIGYIIYFVYAWWWGDPSVFGGNKAYFDKIGRRDDDARILIKETNRRKMIAIIPMAVINFIGVLILGGVRWIWDDVDVNWLCSVGFFVVLLLILVILYFVMGGRKKKATVSGCEKETYFSSNNLFEG